MQFFVDSIQYSTAIEGFTSVGSSHAHLFKHVVPLLENGTDHELEHWEDLIPNPPLEPNVTRRNRKTLDTLVAIDDCHLPRERQSSACEKCHSKNARRQVSTAFSDLLTAYVQVAQMGLNWAFSNPDSSGQPRALAQKTNQGHQIKTIENRGIWCLATLPPGGGTLRLITCYRETDQKRKKRKKKSYEQAWLDLCREKAGCRRVGTLLDIRMGGAS